MTLFLSAMSLFAMTLLLSAVQLKSVADINCDRITYFVQHLHNFLERSLLFSLLLIDHRVSKITGQCGAASP